MGHSFTASQAQASHRCCTHASCTLAWLPEWNKILWVDLFIYFLFIFGVFLVMFRSSFKGWRWSWARWRRTKRSFRGTSSSSPNTRTCWRSRGPSSTAAPEWVRFRLFDLFSHQFLASCSLLLRRGAYPRLPGSILFSCRWHVLFPSVTELELMLTLINNTVTVQLLPAPPDSPGLWDSQLWE